MPKRKSLVSRKPELYAPAFCVGRHQLFGGMRCGAGSQTPGFLHVFGVHTDNGADLIAVSGDKGVAQGAGTPPTPTQSAAGRVAPSAEVTADIAAEPYQIVKFQLVGQNPIQLLVAEAAIRHDQNFNIRRQRLGKLHQRTVLIGVAMALQRRLIDREPHQGRRSTMIC